MGAPEPLNVSRYAEEATARMLAVVGTNTAVDWRSVIDKGLAAAYQQQDAAGLLHMVQLVSNLLDGSGRHEDAVAELDHALVAARSSPDATIVLHGIKACMLAAPARFEAAETALAAGRALLPQSGQSARLRFRVFEKVVAWQRLTDDSTVPTDQLLADLQAADLRKDHSFLLSWYVPYLASLGRRRAAHPWIRMVRLDAQTANSRWRESDAAAFEAWDEFVADPELRKGAAAADRANAMSVWRSEAVRLRDACLGRDATAAQAALHSMTRVRPRLGSADVGASDDYQLAWQAYDGASELEGGEPPDNIHLNNLGSVLARAEAIALAGTQHQAGTWADAMAVTIRPETRSALEWPLSIGRLRGLLRLRSGDVRGARQEFEDALEWARSMGFGTEEAITRLQLGELCASADLRVPERTWRENRRRGAEMLKSRGYDPLPHSFCVAHSLTLSSRNRLAERLTRREVEVLALLAEGKTYRAAAAALGVAQPTVQTLAHRVYEKLGVNGKREATAEARRLGIL